MASPTVTGWGEQWHNIQGCSCRPIWTSLLRAEAIRRMRGHLHERRVQIYNYRSDMSNPAILSTVCHENQSRLDDLIDKNVCFGFTLSGATLHYVSCRNGHLGTLRQQGSEAQKPRGGLARAAAVDQLRAEQRAVEWRRSMPCLSKTSDVFGALSHRLRGQESCSQ